jgi:type II secretory pathway predicted ATPase ExeA
VEWVAALLWNRWQTSSGIRTAQAERHERLLLSLIEQCGRPVVLFVDDAHDLNSQTLVQLKRLIELVRAGPARPCPWF